MTTPRERAGMGAYAEAGWLERLNRLLDRLPRDTVHLGAREVPAFRSLGVLGFHLAVLTALLTGFRAGVPPLDTVSLSAVAGASFFGWGLLRRALSGRESLVQLEYLWVALGAVALLRVATGTAVAPGLDVLCVAVCPFLTLGRVGCLVAGCCHGLPAALGVAYPPSAGLPARLVGVRLFPVPVVEAGALTGIGVAGFLLAGGPAGTATVWVLAAYATVRFGTEALRGDPRPALAGVPVARLMCVLQLAAVLCVNELIMSDGNVRRIAAAAVVLAPVGVAGLVVTRRRRDSLAAPAHLDEVWTLIHTLARTAPVAGHPGTSDTSVGVRLAASWGEYGLHVSFSHPSRPVTGLPHALGLIPIASTGVAIHSWVSATRLPTRPRRADGYHQAAEPGASGTKTGGDYFGDRATV